MKAKTATLTGPALAFFVAKCERIEDWNMGKFNIPIKEAVIAHQYCPHTNFAQGGPIIDREGITIIRVDDDYGVDSKGFCNNVRIPRWCATLGQHGTTTFTEHQSHEEMFQICESEVVYGPTSLIAGMRCRVASELGDEVELPEEFLIQPKEQL